MATGKVEEILRSTLRMTESFARRSETFPVSIGGDTIPAMPLEIFHVDAFASAPFTGNPAAVVLLEEPASPEWMQKVAAEMNLSETAFVIREDDAFGLRWFTPGLEVPLCGHATLASAHTLWETGRLARNEMARFHTRSGVLTAKLDEGWIHLDFPAIVVREDSVPAELLAALGTAALRTFVTPERALADFDYLIELESEQAVAAVQPDFATLQKIPAGVIITARSQSEESDFVSRYFAAYHGIREDPVTGVAHCSLFPFWKSRLGRDPLEGRQLSRRGGRMRGSVHDSRVVLSGQAVTIHRGNLLV
ncbi:MAG: PhzF family phenazine biosynthesis protein [Acidobacteriota bacterium]